MKAGATLWPSLLIALGAFAIDRVHKFVQVSSDCIAIGQSVCTGYAFAHYAQAPFGWSGGEVVTVAPVFDYVLVWNTGISYGMLTQLPPWALVAVGIVALVALAVWWWNARAGLVRSGLALCIGGAVSNLVDRGLYGAVADFFHFHVGEWSFYIFNLADVAITLGVLLLILDVLGVGRGKAT